MRPRFRAAGWLVLLAALLAPVRLPAAPASEVVLFTPQGTVKGVRQAVARFSEPMVPLGDPRGAADPFDVACPETGSGRWIDSRSWVYDFARDLPGGLRCAFRLRAGLTSLGGAAVGGPQEFAFGTGGPAVLAARPSQGDEAIDEEQAFVLTLDAGPDEASLLAHVGFAVDGLPERVGVRVLTGQVRDRLLALPGARPAPEPGVTPRPVVVLQARQRFPSGARVSLVWGRGVATAAGAATEQDQVLPFRVRPPFTATFRCEREHRQAGCVPVTPMTVELSAPVAWEAARRIALVGSDGRRLPPEPSPHGTPAYRVRFKGPFPESAAFRVDVPADLRDDAGRPLANAGAFPLAVRTEPFPPLAKFPARFGIVEAKADPALPVTLRSLEPDLQARLLRVDREPGGTGILGWVRGKILRVAPGHSAEILPWLRRVGRADRETSVFAALPASGPGSALRTVDLPRPDGAQPLQVVGIPLGGPGLYVVELASPRLGASLLGPSRPQRPLYVPAAALVTNLSVHLKWGRETSLVWVTTLDEGRPLRGARVTVYDCRGAALWQGESDREGLARIGRLPPRAALPRCPTPESGRPFFDWSQTRALDGLDDGLFVVAQTPDDLGFVHSSWDQGIEPWRFQLPEGDERGAVSAHTILDRALFRAGDTVHMKHLVRSRTLQGFGRVPDADRPTRVVVRHVGSDDRYEWPVEWDPAGAAASAWEIPRAARLGRYQVVLARPAGRKPPAEAGGGAEEAAGPEWVAAELRVEEFRVPLMRGTLRPPATSLVAASELPLDVAVQYLAGGAARGHPVTLRAQVRPRGWRTSLAPDEALEGYAVANGPVKEGIVRRGGGADEDEEPEAAPATKPALHQREDLRLDAAGTGRVTITRLPRAATPIEVLAELEFRDPNGETQTVAATVPLWPASRLVGIKPDSWVASRDGLRATVAVVDVSGRPVAGAEVRVELFEEKAYSHRKRLVGGFYAYEHVEETRRVGELCRGVTGPGGLLPCEGKPPAEGSLALQASVTDEAGRTSVAHRSVWVAGSEEWWFEARDSDRMDLLPERRTFEPGETARLQVRMPFRAATALVVVEREGVQDAFVASLSGKEPVVELPVRATYAPNTFVSVLAVRGRVGGVRPTALVDLGKPAFKLGVAELRVGWRAHELRVGVAADREVYRVRDRATVRIAVRTADGAAPPPGSEVALAAVDEGLLELAPNRSWGLLEAMMGRRGHEVATATAQMQVVGKRHFGLKAVAQGGGGGRQPTRELFDTLLLWQGRVPLDARGDATVEVPLNDSLTSFRIVAVATGGLGLFGTGGTTIRSTQDLMILPGIAPLVREGDRFQSEVTLRNATERAMDVTVEGRVEGLAAPLPARPVSLGPGEARTVGWEVTAPAGAGVLRYELEAGERGGPRDRLRVSQRVVAAVPVRTVQATLLALPAAGGPLRLPVERPPDALPERGGVQVAFRPTLADGLGGVRDWMTRYPYTCLEQEVSRAVALRSEGRWREIAAALPGSLDGDGLLKYFPTMTWGSEVLTAYVLAIAHEAGWTLPDDVRGRMEGALVRFVEGGLGRRPELPTTDLSLRKLAALEALARYGKVEPGLVSSLTVEPTLWPTSALLDWASLLHRVPALPGRARRLREVEQILRARLSLQGATLGFSTERTDGLWWLMVSPDTNAVRLVLHLLETGTWKDDLPRIVRGALARQRRSAWDLTVANAWGVLAVEKFSRAFERVPVTGASEATLAGATRRLDWAAAPQGGALAFPWSAARDELVLTHAGAGRPWVTVSAQAAIPLAAPLAAGYRVSRTLAPVEQRQPGRWSRGDLLRVRLEVDAQTDMTWVVVSDPVPAGASHLGTGLGRDSRLATTGEEWRRRAWPAFEERGLEGFRAYYAYVPKGGFVLEYTVRLNQPGRFSLPPTRVEALYAPEVFGELPNAPLEVHP